jgi:hypothetical protein
VRPYGETARLLEAFGRDNFDVTSAASITSDHIETFGRGTGAGSTPRGR